MVLSGYGFGSLIWIPMQTAFINPDNVDPDQDDYYMDPELLDRFTMLAAKFSKTGYVTPMNVTYHFIHQNTKW